MDKDFNNYIPSSLHLQNGPIFHGHSPSWQQGPAFGEVVFSTGMTGYPESLTDPSYAGQILAFTYPLIGNYGVPPPDQWESSKIYARGVVVSTACENWSHHSSLRSLYEWLKTQNVPLITGIDTRELTKLLRISGTMLGAITLDDKRPESYADPNHEYLVGQVSTRGRQSYGHGGKTVIAVDCGMKENIVRSLSKWPLTVHRVPHDYDFTEEQYDGVFLSNGPGDPMSCTKTINILRKALQQNKPIFGICLGTQLMALAAGASTYKLPFGHRGQNQPCIDVQTRRCFITSQNHGFAVDEQTLPKDWQVIFRNLNDNSVEGIRHKTKPFFAVQFHPEASPGPTDTLWLFEQFYRML